MARKLGWLYGKRGFLLALAVVAAFAGAKSGGGVDYGFFDGG